MFTITNETTERETYLAPAIKSILNLYALSCHPGFVKIKSFK